MCVPVTDSEKRRVALGRIGEFDWEILHNSMGYLCGYVRIPSDHSWFQISCNLLSHINIHGGLTFANTCLIHPDQWWVGFDCAHIYDAPNIRYMSPELAKEYIEAHTSGDILLGFKRIFRDEEYVKRQIENLIAQAYLS